MAQWVKNSPAKQETQEMWVESLGQEDHGDPHHYSCLKIFVDGGV